MMLCKLVLFRINLEVHFKVNLFLFMLYLFLNPFQAPLAQDSRIA